MAVRTCHGLTRRKTRDPKPKPRLRDGANLEFRIGLQIYSDMKDVTHGRHLQQDMWPSANCIWQLGWQGRLEAILLPLMSPANAAPRMISQIGTKKKPLLSNNCNQWCQSSNVICLFIHTNHPAQGSACNALTPTKSQKSVIPNSIEGWYHPHHVVDPPW
eukprot:214562-Chlamydomonas_euryale.AAC.12